MKKGFLLVFLCLSITFFLGCPPEEQEGTWKIQHDDTTGDIYINFYSVHFFDENNGIALGCVQRDVPRHSYLKTTNNGGETWNTEIVFQNKMYRDMHFVDKNHGCLVGLAGEIATTATGTNWIERSSGTIDDFWDVFFVDQNFGWAAAKNNIYRTNNAGVSWELLTVPNSVYIDKFTGIYFHDQNDGWIVGGTRSGVPRASVIYKTSDGGDTWELNEIPYDPDINSGILWDIKFLNRYFGCSVGVGKILLTYDSQNWVYKDRTFETAFKKVFFLDLYNGWAVGDNEIYYSSNGGQDWELQPCPHVSYFTFWDVIFINKSKGWAVGNQGKIFHYSID